MASARKSKVRPAKRGASPVGLFSTGEVQVVLEHLPGAEFRNKFHGVSFFAGARVFAFQSRYGVVLKLPAERVQALVRERGASALVMGKKVMREWVVVGLPQGLFGEVELLREAMEFVASAGAT